jgi:hypothetical protein
VKVAEVARNMQGHDLPRTFGQKLVSVGKALDNEAALGRAIAFANDILVRLVFLNPPGCLFQELPFFR